MERRSEDRSLLDQIRWVSAIMVAWGHSWAALAAHTLEPINRALWALADTRHSWVVVFFVLSGYLVGGKVLLRSDGFDFAAYALARASRIYIVLLPALALTAGLDGLARLIEPHSPIHAGDWRNGLFGPSPPFQSYSVRHIVASLLSLENVVGAPIGSDGPLWSLGFEWIFYFALPLFMLLADMGGRRWRERIWTARAGVLAMTMALLIAAHALYAGLLWLIWLAGALAHVCVETGRWPAVLRWFGAGLAALDSRLGSGSITTTPIF